MYLSLYIHNFPVIKLRVRVLFEKTPCYPALLYPPPRSEPHHNILGINKCPRPSRSARVPLICPLNQRLSTITRVFVGFFLHLLSLDRLHAAPPQSPLCWWTPTTNFPYPFTPTNPSPAITLRPAPQKLTLHFSRCTIPVIIPHVARSVFGK